MLFRLSAAMQSLFGHSRCTCATLCPCPYREVKRFEAWRTRRAEATTLALYRPLERVSTGVDPRRDVSKGRTRAARASKVQNCELESNPLPLGLVCCARSRGQPPRTVLETALLSTRRLVSTDELFTRSERAHPVAAEPTRFFSSSPPRCTVTKVPLRTRCGRADTLHCLRKMLLPCSWPQTTATRRGSRRDAGRCRARAGARPRLAFARTSCSARRADGTSLGSRVQSE